MRIEQFFAKMNDIDFPYVVMRNYEGLPEVISPDGHNDLDLLVYDFNHWQEIFPQARREHHAPRVQFSLEINGEKLFIDVRSVGDGYYPTLFQMNMLATRKFNGMFFTPDKEHHLLGLVYHVVHHRNSF